MITRQLKTAAKPDWCPGCGNYSILSNFLQVVDGMLSEGLEKDKLVLVSGIGNHGKIVDYVHVNSFNSIHGRAIPVAQAIKLADPELKVVCFVGDGDSYAEGLDHLIFAAKRNCDITVLVHDNRTYGLATGQFTPTSPADYKGPTSPFGIQETPFNPLELMLASGATFIARAYPPLEQHFQSILKAAIMHRGFALVDILQVCVYYNNLYDLYNQHVYELASDDLSNPSAALQLIKAWDYNSTGPIGVGTFYQVAKPIAEEFYPRLTPFQPNRRISVEEALARFI